VTDTAPATQRVVAAASALGLDIDVQRFPEGTRTAADAAAAIGCELGAIVKSIVVMADGQPLVVLASGSNRVDFAKAAAALGAREVRKADAQQVRDATGYAIGGTAPFGYARDVPMLFDQDLQQYEVVWAAAGTPDTVFAITPADLLRTTGARVADVAAA